MDENSHYKSFHCWGCHKGYYNEEDCQDILFGIDYSDRPECPKDEDDEEEKASFIWSCAGFCYKESVIALHWPFEISLDILST